MTDETIFATAVEITDPAERAAFLDEACAGNTERRQRLEALMRAHAAASDFLERPPASGHESATTKSYTIGSDDAAPDDDAAGTLGFLGPSTRPGALGRLGRYEVLEVLGQGGFGVVLRAFDETLQRVVAVKVLLPQLAATSPARKRFLREARASAQIRHENVVQVYEIGEQPLPHLVMEFIPGETLQQHLNRIGPLGVPEVLRIGRQIAEGLAAAHEHGLIHRDIKPGNILLESGLRGRVKITDFGLARAADDASLTQSGAVAGTPMYMAPEQALGETLDHRADLFSLGSVLYQMVSGRPPFRANSTLAVLRRVVEDTPRPIREIIPETPVWLCDLIARLHAKSPAARYQTAREVADLLAECKARGQVDATRQELAAISVPAAPRGKRGRWVVAALLLPVLALGVTELAGLTQLLPRRESRPDEPLAQRDGQEKAVPRVDPATPPKFIEPNPFDRLKRADLSRYQLALAGGGDPERAAPELVGVIAGGPFQTHAPGQRHHPCVSPDGKWLGASCGNEVCLFDTSTGALMHVLRGGTNRSLLVRFSADGKKLAAGNFDGSARVWDVASGRLLLTLTGGSGYIDMPAFSPDGKRVAVGTTTGLLTLFDADTGGKVWEADKLPHQLCGLEFSPDSRTIAVGGRYGLIWLFDVAAGKLTATLTGQKGEVRLMRFHPNGKRLVSSGHEDTQVIVWDLGTGKPQHTLPARGGGALALSPDWGELMTVSNAPENNAFALRRWDLATGKEKPGASIPDQGRPHFSAAVSPDLKVVYGCPEVGPVGMGVFDAATGKELFTPPGDGIVGAVWDVAVSPDGRLLATAGADKTVRLFDLTAWKPGQLAPPCKVLSGHTGEAWSLAFSPDGTRLASAGMDNTVILWEVPSGKKLRDPLCRCEQWARIGFSPDGGTLAVPQPGGKVALVNLGGERKAEFAPHADRIQNTTFSPEGKLLVSAGVDNKARVTDVRTGKVVHTLDAGQIRAVFAPDGKALYTVVPGSLCAWDTATWKPIPVFPGHNRQVIGGLAVHPGGRLVATSAYDGSVVVCDVPTGRAKILAPGDPANQNHRVEGVAFTPDGKYLVASSVNSSVWIFRTPDLPTDPPGPPSKKVIDLLAMVKPNRDVVRGRWVRRGPDLVASSEGEQSLELPYQPPEEYDLTVELTLGARVRGESGLAVPYARSRQAVWLLSRQADGHLFAWKHLGNGGGGGQMEQVALPEAHHRVRMEVRKTGVGVFVNDKLWGPLWDGGPLPPAGLSQSRDGTLPALVSYAPAVYHRAELVEVSGGGWAPYGGVVEAKNPLPPPKRPAGDGSADRRAAEWALSAGGSVRVRQQSGAEKNVGKVEDLPSGPFTLYSVNLQERPVTVGGLANLKGLAGLTTLNLWKSGVADEHLAAIAGLVGLRELHLGTSRFTDAGLAHLKGLTDLRVIGLDGNPQLTDAALEHLAGLRSLMELRVSGSKVTLDGLRKLRKAVPGCRFESYYEGDLVEIDPSWPPDRKAATVVLAVGGGVNVQVGKEVRGIGSLADLPGGLFQVVDVNLNWRPLSDTAMANFKGCTGIRTVSLHYTGVTDKGLANFSDSKGLRSLWMHCATVTDKGLAFLKDCKEFETLSIDAVGGVTDAGLAHLKGCEKLAELNVFGCQVTDQGLVHLKNCTNLRGLGLNGLGVTGSCFAEFKDLSKLEGVRCEGSALTDEGLMNLVRAKNLKRVNPWKTRVTLKGAEAFHAALPTCRVEHTERVFEAKK